MLILKRFEKQHLPLDFFLNLYFKSNKALGSKDRKAIAESVYGIIKWKGLIDHLASPFPSWEKRYSLFHSIDLKKHLYNQQLQPFIRVSCPKDLFALLEKQYGIEKALELGAVCNTQAPITIRANRIKITRDDLLALLSKNFEVTEGKYCDAAIILKKRAPLFDSEMFKQGLFEMQDEGSQLVASLVNPQPGEKVLDYCSGSGGKSLAFAHKMDGKGQLYLHDIRVNALNEARKRLTRAGISNAQFLIPEHCQLKRIKGQMDWVIADVPCSGTGTFRRNPEMKWKFCTKQLDLLALEQKILFGKALKYLKKGGKIVYATCSILSEENEHQIEKFLNAYPISLQSSPLKILPTEGGMDGFFAAVFQLN